MNVFEAAKIVPLLEPLSIRERTAEARDRFDEQMSVQQAERTPEETRLQAIADHIETDDEFGCRRRSIRKLVELIIETELPRPLTTVARPPIDFVVGAIYYSNALYLGCEIDADADLLVINERGTGAGYLSPGNEDARPASEEEVEQFITAITALNG